MGTEKEGEKSINGNDFPAERWLVEEPTEHRTTQEASANTNRE